MIFTAVLLWSCKACNRKGISVFSSCTSKLRLRGALARDEFWVFHGFICLIGDKGNKSKDVICGFMRK